MKENYGIIFKQYILHILFKYQNECVVGVLGCLGFKDNPNREYLSFPLVMAYSYTWTKQTTRRDHLHLEKHFLVVQFTKKITLNLTDCSTSSSSSTDIIRTMHSAHKLQTWYLICNLNTAVLVIH